MKKEKNVHSIEKRVLIEFQRRINFMIEDYNYTIDCGFQATKIKLSSFNLLNKKFSKEVKKNKDAIIFIEIDKDYFFETLEELLSGGFCIFEVQLLYAIL